MRGQIKQLFKRVFFDWIAVGIDKIRQQPLQIAIIDHTDTMIGLQQQRAVFVYPRAGDSLHRLTVMRFQFE